MAGVSHPLNLQINTCNIFWIWYYEVYHRR